MYRLTEPRRGRGASKLTLVLIMAGSMLLTALVAFVVLRMFENKQDARRPYHRVVEVSEISTDSEVWGLNWPHHYDGWKATAGDEFYGGSSAMPESKLEQSPWLVRLYAGYAFSKDYREARGHAYMLYDQGVTERVHQAKQAGACLHCHASGVVMYRKVGLEAMGQPADEAALAAAFNMEAVIRGFREVSRKPYFEVYEMIRAAPDGTPDENSPTFPEAPKDGFHGGEAVRPVDGGEAHPVGCIDCHDPKTMRIRVTRPGFVLGIQALAAGDGDASHLASIEKWRRGRRDRPYDPNRDASRQEMRSYVCAQCHVEYYCATGDVLQFPWAAGLRAEDLEKVWDDKTFPDGTGFFDYAHGETGARVLKVQHPEFELWSQGIHARSGVSCADCHMPYERHGAMKLSSHDVKSPMERVHTSCQTCHNVEASALEARVDAIQKKTVALMEKAAGAMTDMLDAILEAKAAGVEESALADIYLLQRKAMWRLDYISSENSKGFHADQEAARILAESIDYSRQAEAAALRLRAPPAPSTDSLPREPVRGVSKTKPRNPS